MRAVLLLAAMLLVGSRASADENADFATTSASWNGGARLLAAAREVAPRVRAPRTLDLDEVGRDDVVFLFGPSRPLPEADLVDFVRHGGQLVIADDFGTAGPLLARFGIRRTEVGATAAPRVRGQDHLLVARAFYAHPLTEGVTAVVTNRPMLLEHPRLVPLLGLDEGGGAILLTGVVGEGRVVAISDPSLFIDQMMVLTPNRTLAENVIRFAVGEARTRTVHVAAGDVRFEGRFDGASNAPPRERLEALLERIARTRLPDEALRVAATSLVLLSALLFTALRSRRKEPPLPWLASGSIVELPESSAEATAVALIRRALERRLGLGARAQRSERMRAVRALRLPPSEERRMLAALDALDRPTKGRASSDSVLGLVGSFQQWLSRRPRSDGMDPR